MKAFAILGAAALCFAPSVVAQSSSVGSVSATPVSSSTPSLTPSATPWPAISHRSGNATTPLSSSCRPSYAPATGSLGPPPCSGTPSSWANNGGPTPPAKEFKRIHARQVKPAGS